jgi:hypothetical protein
MRLNPDPKQRAEGVVVIAAGWLEFLGAAAHPDEDYAFLPCKAEHPRIKTGDPVYVVCEGKLRCRISALRFTNGVQGFSLLVRGSAIAAAEPVTIAQPIGWFLGYRAPWWSVGDERPFPCWLEAYLPRGVGEAARWRMERLKAPAPALNPPTPPSPAHRTPAPLAPSPRPPGPYVPAKGQGTLF